MFESNQGFYCCVPKEVTCEKEGSLGWNVTCPKGNKLKWEEMCYFQNTCPVSVWSSIAVESKCDHLVGDQCPDEGLVSKVCNSASDTVNIQSNCHKGEICPKAKKGIEYEQCFFQ